MSDLYLFDIDGTLVRMDDVHLKVFQDAYLSILGIDVSAEIILPTFGEVQPEQHRIILEAVGIPPSDNLKKKLENYYFSNISRKAESSKLMPLEGVLNFLGELHRRGDYVGVLTGHKEESGMAILRSAGLDNSFSVFGFLQDGHKNREDIANHVIRKAIDKGYRWEKMFVIGDTTSDVKCGKTINAYAVGVATGRSSADELWKAGADLVLPSLTGYRKIFTL